MRWKQSRNDDGISLDDLVPDDDFPKGGAWSYSDFFVQVDVILANRMKPSEFGLCDPEDDLDIMMAHNSRKSKMSNYEQKEAKAKAKAASMRK